MQVIRVIERGGFGVVEEVEEAGQWFARKRFDPLNSDPDERAKMKRRFAKEVRIQSLIKHPNIMGALQVEVQHLAEKMLHGENVSATES